MKISNIAIFLHKMKPHSELVLKWNWFTLPILSTYWALFGLKCQVDPSSLE